MAPARPRGLFGREPDVARLRALVDGGSGLVTVLGPGGMGKTSLVELLAAQGRTEGRRVVWVDLEAVQTVDELTGATRRAVASQLLGQPSPVSADEPAEVALEHLDVGEKMMGEPHRLSPLEMGVARDDDIGMP
jgi:ABC-type lipoprotein export system ATPase subunit